MNRYLTLTEVSNCLGLSKAIISGWEKSGKLLPAKQEPEKLYHAQQLLQFDAYRKLADSTWDLEQHIRPIRPYRSIELFAGAGGGLHWDWNVPVLK